jgi:carbamoyltransferase
MSGALLGPGYGDDEIAGYLDAAGIPYTRHDPDALARAVASRLAEGAVVGWFQDRMEFGPRALGARSILGDARRPEMQSVMNLKIKYRESFRPFAPAVLDEDTQRYFDLKQESPYMLVVAGVGEAQRVAHEPDAALTGMELLRVRRSAIPAVTHVDMSARVQTVSAHNNPAFHRLLRAFKAETGCSVLVNTSFNVRGEPIVRSPQEAYTCFMRTNIDALAIEGFLLEKADQPQWREEDDWRNHIPLD